VATPGLVDSLMQAMGTAANKNPPMGIIERVVPDARGMKGLIGF